MRTGERDAWDNFIYIYIYIYIYLVSYLFIYLFIFSGPSLIAAFYAEEITLANNIYIYIYITYHKHLLEDTPFTTQ